MLALPLQQQALKALRLMKLPKLIVADECVEYEIILQLRQNNISVLSIMESHSGIKDIQVLSIAVEKKAFLLTEDKDFGELVFRLQLEHEGILLVRFPNNYDPDVKAEKVVKTMIQKFNEIDNNFCVLDENRLRIRHKI